MPLEDRWKRLRYTVYAPFYDYGLSFANERRAAIAGLAPQPGEKLLIVGVGTGADLAYLPDGVEILGVDVTPAMLARAAQRAGPNATLREMDGQQLDLEDGTFDAVLLHQILAVIPDPVRCLREATRVLRPGGRISIFDKFLPDDARPSRARMWALRSLDTIFTSPRWTLSDLLGQMETPLHLEQEVPCGGSFRTVLLRKSDLVDGQFPG